MMKLIIMQSSPASKQVTSFNLGPNILKIPHSNALDPCPSLKAYFPKLWLPAHQIDLIYCRGGGIAEFQKIILNIVVFIHGFRKN
jgi:hypothetical protein